MRGDPYDDPRITAIGLFDEAHGGLMARFAAQFAEHRLTQVEYEVLLRLVRSPEGALRMTDLAAQTQLTTSGITRVVDRLERDGMVDRRACPTDRRGLLATVTKTGRDRLDAVLPGHLALVDEWFLDRLGPDQRDTFLAALRTIRDAVRPDATAGAPPDQPRPDRPRPDRRGAAGEVAPAGAPSSVTRWRRPG